MNGLRSSSLLEVFLFFPKNEIRRTNYGSIIWLFFFVIRISKFRSSGEKQRQKIMSYFVYILYSKKIDQYYIGSSYDPDTRLHYHNLGKKGWTKRGIPWKLVFKKEYKDKDIALEKEKYVKKQKSSEFIEKLVSGEYLL